MEAFLYVCVCVCIPNVSFKSLFVSPIPPPFLSSLLPQEHGVQAP